MSREPYSLNGGESGEWFSLNLDPEATQPILAPANLSDSDIDSLLNRLNESPELAPVFLPASLLYT